MSRAGSWLHRAASRICGSPTMERLVEPILADMRYEHERALARGQRWRAWRVRAAGYLGFWTALFLHAAAAVPRAALSLAAATNGWLIGRIVAIAIAVFIGVTAVMILPPLAGMPRIAPGSGGRLAMYLVPQAMFLAIPLALSVGIAYGCRGRPLSWRIVAPVLILAICGTAAAFATREWLIPEANQAFRVWFVPEGGALQRGPGEMPLTALGARIDALRADGSAAAAARLSRIFHMHWALCFASAALSLIGLGLSTFSSRRIVAVAVGAGTPLAYWASLAFLDAALVQRALHPAIVWLPNVVFIAGGAVLLARRRRASPVAPATH